MASLAFLVGCGDGDEGDVEPSQWRAGWSVAARGGLTGAVYVPTAQGVVGTGRGLMVVLHGCAQTYGNLQTYGSWTDTAEEHGMVVSLPGVAGGGVYFGCWDYYGSNHSRGAGDAADLLAHVSALLADASLGIDPDQVYIAGLSSGGGMAMVMGCLAPDVFAGVGIAAGPAVGTTAFQTGSVAVSASTARTTCEGLAGGAIDHFDTQQAGVIAGTNDYTVAQGYATVDAEAFASLYAARRGLPSLTSASLGVAALPGYQPAGTGTQWSDEVGPRVVRISAQGMGHAWPAGTGPGAETSFVARQGVDFAAVLAAMFTEGNRRVDPGEGDDGVIGGGGSSGGDDAGGGTTGGGDDAGGDDAGGDDAGGGTTGGGDDAGGDDAGGDDAGGGTTGGADGGDGGEPPPPPCEPWVATATAPITGHLSRFALYPAGYGVADITYVALLSTYGLSTPFTLYRAASGAWYHLPSNVPGTCG